MTPEKKKKKQREKGGEGALPLLCGFDPLVEPKIRRRGTGLMEEIPTYILWHSIISTRNEKPSIFALCGLHDAYFEPKAASRKPNQ